MSSFSCFVVGSGVLGLKCLEILLQAKHQVLGVYSIDNSLEKFAKERDIPHAASLSAFQDLILSTQYDYLFSINNVWWIVPPKVLAQSRKATINFHDSPLPKYAGLHATSWALIHGEPQHGITWHEVVSEVDAGRIFKQQTVAILENDTAFSLNARCLDVAIATFDELVRELATDCLEPLPQDLSQRSYFSER